MQITRRAALRGATAVAAMSAVPAIAVANDVESLLALEEQWQAGLDESRRQGAFYDEAHARLPVWAKCGPDGRGSE